MSTRPKLGALAVVLKGDSVLLAQRQKAPDAGLWGYPGGHVEWGETIGDAAVRELREETGIVATPGQYLANLDLIKRDSDGKVTTHYLLVAVLCHYVSGTPSAVTEIADARWVSFEDIAANALPMSARVSQVLNKALEAAPDLSV